MAVVVDSVKGCDSGQYGLTWFVCQVDVGIAADIGTLQRMPKIVGNDSKAQ